MRRLAFALTLATLVAAPAAASVAVRAAVEDLAETAELVADGVVLDHSSALDAAAGAIFTTYRVRVATALAGASAAEIAVRVPGGRIGTMEQETIGAPELTDGARVVLFLGSEASGARGVVGLAQGVFRVETDPVSRRIVCRNSLAGLSVVDRDGRPTSAEPLELSLADLTARVMAGRERRELRRRAADEALARKLAGWRRAAEMHAAATHGRPGGSRAVMPDRVVLEGLEVEALVGVFEHERHARRPLLVDLELVCDLARAAASDRIEDTVDYFALTTRVRERCAASSYRLIEALAGDIARTCLEETGVSHVTVKLRKPGAVAGVATIAVVLERDR